MTARERAEDLFHEARSLPADVDRYAWIAMRCPGESELIAEVASLLEAHAEVGRAMKPRVEEPPAEVPGALFGPYRPVALIGRGGMSTVYRAVREGAPFEQSVALKILAPFLGGAEFVRRFETECRLLAQLEHLNITRLLDGGVAANGQSYLVTELVQGERFDSYSDSRRLSIPVRLQLFLQLCEAVDYAHRNLIVHRDLKPANVLIHQDGVVKLLDFGTATLLAAERQETITRARMLTPRYASPEQLRAERVGTASDIYSLGIILYELLTGAWPFGDAESLVTELNRATGRIAPRPLPGAVTAESAAARGTAPRQLERLLKGDVAAIALKALEDDPARRYATVRELTGDLRSYLAGHAVRARGYALTYRARRFIGRNRFRIVAGAAVAAFLSAAGIYSVSQYGREQRRLAELRTLSESYLSDVYREVEKLPGSTKACFAIVERARNSLDALFAESPRDPRTRRALAAAYLQLAELEGEPFHINLGNTQGAIEHFEKARQVVAAASDRESQALWIRGQIGLAGLQVRSGAYRNAAAALRATIPVAQKLAAAAPRMSVNGKSVATLYIRAQILLGHALLRDADVDRNVDHVRDALRTFEEACEIAGQLSRVEPALIRTAGVASQYAGYAFELLGDFTHDVAYYERGLDAHRRGMESARREFEASPAPQTQRDYADTLGDYGWCQHLCHRREAIATISEAVALMKSVSEADPESEEARLDFANVLARLGAAEVESNRIDAGLEHLAKAQSLIQLPGQIRASDRELVVLFARIQESRAKALGIRGQSAEAAAALKQAVDAARAGHSVPDWRLAELEQQCSLFRGVRKKS